MLDEDRLYALREFSATSNSMRTAWSLRDLRPSNPCAHPSNRPRFYRSTINGDKNRYKLRLRFYNDRPDSPVFFEIKRRVNNCILKQRGGVKKEAVRWLLEGHLPGPEHLLRNDSKSLVAIQNFLRLVEHLHARPLAHVAYLREAYVNPATDNVRVTLDRAVRTEARAEPSFSTEMQNPSRPFGDRVILELKFTDRFPDWCRRLVERFGLMQCGAAKYCEGLAGLPEFALGHAGDFRETPGHGRSPANSSPSNQTSVLASGRVAGAAAPA